jgi:hypothetical protein
MIGKIFPVSTLVLVLVCNVSAAEVALNDNPPTSHVVVKGDTLWDIAGRFLRYPWQWPQIWNANQQIENPHLIYPGDEIFLTYKDGRPLLGLRRARYVKLSPGVREHARERAIPPIPLDAIHQFLSRPRVLSPEDIDGAAYVVGSQDEHLATGRGNKIYIRGILEKSVNRFSVFRPGEEYLDPDTNQSLGQEALHIADVVIHSFGDPTTALITWSNREVVEGDRLYPQELEEFPEFVPHAPESVIDGRIISVIDGVLQIGKYHVVVLNKGTADGLAPGHVLAIFQAGAMIKDRTGTEQAHRQRLEDLRRAELENPSAVGRFFDGLANGMRAVKLDIDKTFNQPIGGLPVTVQLPEERAGELMIFRSFDAVSYALIMHTQRPIHLHDKVRNP